MIITILAAFKYRNSQSSVKMYEHTLGSWAELLSVTKYVVWSIMTYWKGIPKYGDLEVPKSGSFKFYIECQRFIAESMSGIRIRNSSYAFQIPLLPNSGVRQINLSTMRVAAWNILITLIAITKAIKYREEPGGG